MATKIEGWANGNPAYPGRHHSFTDLNSGVGVKATLVIGDERVFTESEVRAYGDDLLSAHMSPGQIVDRADDYEEPLYRWIDRAIKAVNAKHGLSDPA